MSFTWGPLSGGSHLLLTPVGGSSTGFHYYRLLRGFRNMIFTQSDATAARRRFHLYLVDATDGITAETGEAAGQPQISKGGGAWTNTTNTLTAIGNGTYYVELTTTEINTVGKIAVRYKSAATAEFCGVGEVFAADLFQVPHANVIQWKTVGVNDAGGTSGGDVPAYVPSGNTLPTGAITAGSIATDAIGAAELAADAAAEIADAVWDELRFGHGTVGSFGEGVSSVQGSVTGSVASIGAGGITSGTFGAGAITANAIADDAIGATELAATAVAEIADAVWDEAISGHSTAGTTGALFSEIDGQTNSIASQVWDVAIASHIGAGSTGEALNATPNLTVQNIVDGVWDEPATSHTTDGTMGANLQDLADAVLVWPTPVGGGVTASTLIQRAMAISDMHDNFVSQTEWLNWLNQEQYALRLFMARNGWQLPFDTTTATITSTGWTLSTDGGSDTPVTSTAAGHYIFTPTSADVMALVCIHQSISGRLKRLDYNNTVDFLRQTIGSTNTQGNAREYRCRMYGNYIHIDFYPTPIAGETYVLTYLNAPVPLTATTQAVTLPMGWEERLVLGMARRAIIKEESDPTQIEKLIRDMDSQIEQLCWSRVTSEAPRVRNTDPNVGGTGDFPVWQYWYWR